MEKMEKTYQFDNLDMVVILSENINYFRVKELAEFLDYKRAENALHQLDDDEKLLLLSSVSGQQRKTWFVNESGLYHLIIKSTKPEAKKFRKWITTEVLPSIRKAGSYSPDQVSQKQAQLEDVKILLDKKKTDLNIKKSELKELDREIIKLEKEFWSVFKSDPAQLQLYPNEVMDNLKSI